jgi:glyoxylase-like metal-dependent hydrolase (beta-lactamase superfamily II)
MNFGDYRIEIIPDTEFRLDGGAMFGVVPRVLWERVCPPDELNRVRLNMNCLFVETPQEKILIETGIGEKWSEKETRMYGIFREKPFAQTLLERTGYTPEDITIVVNTHLHFDHAGGNTVSRDEKTKRRGAAESVPPAVAGGVLSDAAAKERDGKKTNPHSAFRIPQFKNARYFVSASEFEHAENPHERDRASYLPENWQPLKESGQLELKPDNYEVVPGLKMQTIRGHSKTMQTVRLDCGGQTLYGFADLIPTRHHVALPWIMGYDLYPTETLEFKKSILPLAVKENWMCLFYHDFEMPLCRLGEDNGRINALPVNS